MLTYMVLVILRSRPSLVLLDKQPAWASIEAAELHSDQGHVWHL